MNWKIKDPKEEHDLVRLGALTVRLMRIAAFQQLARGQTQLRAHKIPADLKSPYLNHVQEENRKLKEKTRPKSLEDSYPNLRIVEKGTF